MDNLPLFVGLDYHQDSIQVCVIDAAANVRSNRACGNDAAAVLAALGPASAAVRKIALEACCGAADLADELAGRGDWCVELAHPTYVAKLKGSPDKTDFSDARLLADLSRVGYLPRVWRAPTYIRELRQLVNHRQRLVNRRRDLKLQVGAILREQRVKIEGSGGRWSALWVARVRDNARLSAHARWIVDQTLDEILHAQEQIHKAEQRLRGATAADQQVVKLRTIEGVGEVTSWMLRAWIGRFDRFRSGKQLSRYCGLSPRNASSGNRQADAGLINGAHPQLRAALIQAGQRLIRTHDRWRSMADALIRRGKAKNLAIVAVANRWVRSMHHRMIE